MTGAFHRGATAVGVLSQLGAVEAGAVLYWRLWCDGPTGREQIEQDFVAMLGPWVGETAFKSFAELCDLCARHARRPLMRHHVTCKCIGADEACFANFIAAATDGDREDAFLIATLLVRADMAACLLGHAKEFGVALKLLSTATKPAIPSNPSFTTVH